MMRSLIRALLATLVCAVTACSGLLDVTDPTLVQDSGIANPAGANARRLSVMDKVNNWYGRLSRNVALFTDERMMDLPYPAYQAPTIFLDERDGIRYESYMGSTGDPHLGPLDEIVTASSIAIPAVRAYTPDSLQGDFLAQLFALRGLAIVQMAEDLCPGFPINEVKDNLPVFSKPYTTEEALAFGLAQLDTALAQGQDSVRFLNLARVVKGRALLDLGQYGEAAAVVAPVPTAFSYKTDEVSNGSIYQESYSWENGNPEAVGDREGGTGLPFVSAHDPRVGTRYVQGRHNDPTDSLYDQTKYQAWNTPVEFASGIEARLIEAEAALAAGDAQWFAKLNDLRKTAIVPAMDTIGTVPPTAEARVDLLYSERAFWLYLTGRRLGDIRRLIRNYGRGPETVLPTGTYPSVGVYGPSTAIPFVLANQRLANPHITTGCTVR